MRNEIWRSIGPAAFAIAVTLALAGCGSSEYLGKPKEVDPNIVPANYKKEIVDTLKGVLIDPTNVKDAFVSEPALTTVGKEQRYASCVRVNSRGYHREYLGSKDRIAYFFGGHLNQLVDASKEQCGNAAYKPFPEVEKLCLGKSCE
ncbi:MAG: hypothetical protein PSV22_21625 [Pseudolabrys sp.]|nr:hypothetical protein [Pseudolabrys sp.]